MTTTSLCTRGSRRRLAFKGASFYPRGMNSRGLRASLYNAMPLAGVQALVDFLQDFERTHG